MTHAIRVKRFPDDVDRMVDSLLSDPSRADDIKSALRRRLRDAETPTLKSVAAVVASVEAEDDADMWDNVPV